MTTPGSGRVSPAVYRRRRLAAVLLLVLVVVIVVVLLTRPWAGAAPSGATPSPSASATASSTPTATPSESSATPGAPATAAADSDAEPCDTADISVGASTSSDSYAPQGKPELSLSVTNTGDTVCSLNVGTSQQQFIIMEGSETVWRSTDCQSASSDAIVELQPGATVASSEPVYWERVHSSPDSCDADREEAEADGARYTLKTKVGDISSSSDASFVLE